MACRQKRRTVSKYKRCVRKVKKKGTANNPYAVCSFLKRKKMTGRRRKKKIVRVELLEPLDL